jgi:hypothetical protein
MFNNLIDIKNFIPSKPFLSHKMWILRHVLEVPLKWTTIDNNPKMHVKPKMAFKKN